jgi:hypothetical protein
MHELEEYNHGLPVWGILEQGDTLSAGFSPHLHGIKQK